jgi:hypothetical protein
VTRVLADSVDPLGELELSCLDRLAREGVLPWRDAVLLLPKPTPEHMWLHQAE